MSEIVTKEHPALRQIAKEVSLADIATPKIQGVIEQMRSALKTQEDGVAIAAPQIGEALRIFVVSKKVFEMLDSAGTEKNIRDCVFINPTIVKISKTRKLVEEGCLSVRWLYGKMKRATKATVSAYNEKGQKFERGGSGLLAQIFQHEIDHLNGVLFIDTAHDLHELAPSEVSSRFKKKKETTKKDAE